MSCHQNVNSSSNGVRDGGGGAGILNRGEGAVRECDATSSVVDANVELSPTGAAHDIGLDLLIVIRGSTFNDDFLQGNHQVKQFADLDGAVHLRKLGEETREKRILAAVLWRKSSDLNERLLKTVNVFCLGTL